MSQYKIVYSGTLKAGTEPEQFVRRFMEMFKVPEENARKLVTVGHSVTLKTRLEQTQAEKLCEAMAGLGMEVRVEAMAAEPAEGAPKSNAPAAAPENGAPRCPKCGSDRINGDDCLACGIIIPRYKERQARLAAEAAAKAEAAAQAAAEASANPYAPPGADVTPAHVAGIGPRTVPAGNGWRWIADAWDHFKQNPGAWIGAVVIWVVLMGVMSLIPFVGSLATSILGPVFLAGFLLGANAQAEGGDFEVSHLFAGFSNRPGPLVLVGVLYLVGALVIGIIVFMVFGAALFAVADAPSGANVAALLPALLGMVALAVVLLIPLLMAYWFAPALVVLDGMDAMAAMKASFMACLKNTVPFLLYGIVLFVLLIVAMIPVGLGLLVLAPVITASIYTSYRDIFPQPDGVTVSASAGR